MLKKVCWVDACHTYASRWSSLEYGVAMLFGCKGSNSPAWVWPGKVRGVEVSDADVSIERW